MICGRSISLLVAVAALLIPTVVVADWGGPAPEDLPRVTLRYRGVEKDVLIVEGEDYRVTTRREPAGIVAIEIDGENILAEPIIPGFVDRDGVRYVPQRSGVPTWKTYQGQGYRPAKSAAARYNVWNAGPYYWDAHVLDIPLVAEEKTEPTPPGADGETLREWTFDDDTEGWGGTANHCTSIDAVDGALRVAYEGNDPYFHSPGCNEDGPLAIYLRVRSDAGGVAQLYYATDRQGFGEGTRIPFAVEGARTWQEIRVPWAHGQTLKEFRIDPPGGAGTFEIDRVTLRQIDRTALRESPIVRGEIIFHAFPDRLNIEFRVDPEKTGVVPARASWTVKADAMRTALDGRGLLVDNAALLGRPGQTVDGATGRVEAPLIASPHAPPRCWWVLRPIDAAGPAEDLFHEELNPLPAKSFTVRSGHYLGYDAAAGLHVIEALTPGTNFNSAYDNPNRRIEVPVTIRGDDRPRRIFVKSISHVGMLPATVLADEHGFMLPTPIVSCKNFAGEREEPDDSAFGHAFFPIDLAPNEEKSFSILHLFQNWGDHMLKQVSSIRFFHIYWHLSTGVSETTCFTIPWMKLNGMYVRIPDYRPYSGPFWKGQPQHHCVSWPGLLQYRADNQEVRLVYERTVFESIAPNLARFTMQFRSSDGAVRAAATAMEIPQSDEMRTFLKIRYDWEKDVTIDGDARKSFRWLNVNDKKLPRMLVYLDEEGEPATEDLPGGGREILARALGATFAFIGTHGQPGSEGVAGYNSLVLLRSFTARLGGEERARAYFSSRYGGRGGNYWLTAPDEKLELKAGDFIEAEVMLMAHAGGTEPLVVPSRERIYYGTEGPVAQVRVGRKIRDFPATVEAADEVAALTVRGGTEMTPVIIKGFRHWAVPLLWIGGVWQNQQAHGGDGYQVDPDGDGRYRFTFLIRQRRGHPRTMVITRAQCSTGISEMTDRSGYLELSTGAPEGTFTLKAPAVFGPGTNTVIKGAPVISFAGTAKTVRQVPLTVQPKDERVAVEVRHADEETVELTVSGAATLTFLSLTPGATYRLAVDEEAETKRVPVSGRSISVETKTGRHTIALSRRRPQDG